MERSSKAVAIKKTSSPRNRPSHKQDTAWGLSKSAWSFHEFARLVPKAMKQRGV